MSPHVCPTYPLSPFSPMDQLLIATSHHRTADPKKQKSMQRKNAKKGKKKKSMQSMQKMQSPRKKKKKNWAQSEPESQIAAIACLLFLLPLSLDNVSLNPDLVFFCSAISKETLHPLVLGPGMKKISQHIRSCMVYFFLL